MSAEKAEQCAQCKELMEDIFNLIRNRYPNDILANYEIIVKAFISILGAFGSLHEKPENRQLFATSCAFSLMACMDQCPCPDILKGKSP